MKYYMLRACLSKRLNQKAQPDVPPAQPVTHTSHIRFPEINLPRFSGRLADWCVFRDAFDSAIGSRVEISNVEKFQYLKGLVQGDAAKIIESFSISEDGYRDAWRALKLRYENKRQLIRCHIKSLFEVPSIKKESADELLNLMERFEQQISVLRRLGEDTSSWDSLLVYQLSTRLDPHTLKEWESYCARLDSGNVANVLGGAAGDDSDDDDMPTYMSMVNYLQNYARVLQCVKKKLDPLDTTESHICKPLANRSLPDHFLQEELRIFIGPSNMMPNNGRNNNNYNRNSNNYNQHDNNYNHRKTNEDENGLRMEVEKYKKLWKDTEEKMLLIANTYQRVIKSLLKQNSDAISNNKTAMEAEKYKELWEQSEESKARLEELYQRDIKDLYDDRRDAANDMAAKEKKFDNKLKALEAKLSNEKILNEALSQEVTMLKTREEEYALSVAENKTAINSELESKESEVRELKVQLESNKKNMEEALINRDILRNEVNDLQDKLAATEEKVKILDSTISLTVTTCNKQKNELESQFVELEQRTLDLEKENHYMKTVIISLEQEKSDISSKFVEFERKILDLEKENHLMKTVIINLEQQKSDLNKHLPESIDKSEKLLNEKDTLSTKVQELEENSKCFSSYEKVTSFKGPSDNFCVINEETQNKLTSTLKHLKKAHAEKASEQNLQY
nr:uncharacterized protein PFB0145c-like [Aedes albopictus]